MTQPNINAINRQPLSATPKSAVTHKLYSVASSATVGTFTTPEGANSDLVFTIADLSGGETIAVTYSDDGTNFTAIGNVVDAATGLDTTGATLASGTYALPIMRFGTFKYIKFTKSAASNPCRIAVAQAALAPYF